MTKRICFKPVINGFHKHELSLIFADNKLTPNSVPEVENFGIVLRDNFAMDG